MTCAHVLGLIDAGPFADCPRAHLDAAREHAQHCPGCRPALEAAAVLTRNLAALPRPAPPPELAGAVLARIARIEPVGARVAPARPEATPPPVAHDWSPLATMLGSVGAGLALAVATLVGDRAPIDITAAWPSAVLLSASLALYIAGLFAPLGRTRDR